MDAATYGAVLPPKAGLPSEAASSVPLGHDQPQTLREEPLDLDLLCKA
jgi:hypothetical protein